jgi:hypothetical protein
MSEMSLVNLLLAAGFLRNEPGDGRPRRVMPSNYEFLAPLNIVQELK